MSSDPHQPQLLRRTEQGTIAALLLVALVAMALWWVRAGGLSGKLIELERAEPQSAQFLVDINQADWPELAQLPEIGEELARRIVASRETHGPYLDHEDLVRVRGIGPRTLERIRGYLVPLPDRQNMVGK